VNARRIETPPEDPSSDRWLEYYREAKVRRRALGPRMRTRARLKRWRNRQRAFVVGGFAAIAVLSAIFYALLG
jgi:hypothetical protein